MTMPTLELKKDPLWYTLLRGIGPYVAIFLISVLMYYFGERMLGGAFHAKIYSVICISIVMAVSLNIVNGFTGQFSLGHAGFMAVGGYTSGFITYYGSMKIWGNANINGGFLGSGDMLFLASLLAGGLVAGICGYIVGLPSLRLRGDYLAIVTLGFGEIIRVINQLSSKVVYSAEEIAEAPLVTVTRDQGQLPSVGGLVTNLGGAMGFDGIPKYNSLFWCTLFALITILVCYRIKQSVHGKAFLSIRENEIAAEAMGVPTTVYKVKAFVLAAFFAGIGGGLFAAESGVLLNPRELAFQKSLDFVIMVVLGGMGSISGSVLSAIVLTILPEALRFFSEYRMIIYAVLLLLVMLLRPQGLFGIHEFWELKWFRRIFGARKK